MAIRLSEIGKPSLRNVQSWYKDQKVAEQGTEPGAEVKCCSPPPLPWHLGALSSVQPGPFPVRCQTPSAASYWRPLGPIQLDGVFAAPTYPRTGS